MSTTLGAFDYSRTRGVPSSGQVTLASDPLAAVANTLRVSITDSDGNNRDAVLATVVSGDVIRIDENFAVVVGTPVDNVTYWGFPFTVFSAFEEADEPADAASVTLQSRTPAAWPDTDELAQVLNIENAADWDTTLDRVLASAIAKVKSDAGLYGEADGDLPTPNQAQAALRMAEMIATRPDSPANSTDKTYLRLLTGQRRRFGLA